MDDYYIEVATRLADSDLQASRKWLYPIDRSSLGFYALPIEVLCAADVIESQSLQEGKEYALSELREITVGRFHDAVVAAGIVTTGSVFSRAISEIAYWGELIMDEPFRRPENMDVEAYRTIKLMASSDSSMHPYFEAGIWDTSLVQHFIDEGIDADLAVKVYG